MADVASGWGFEMVRLDQVNIVVEDMEAMSAFYERLGVPIQRGLPQWAPHHRNTGSAEGIDIDLDSDEFAAVWNEGWPGGGGIVLGFRVGSREEVDRLYEDLTAAGYTGQQPPYDAFWGSRYAIVADPDGNAVGLMSPADDERRTPPPTPPS
ncbi:MAG: VOC family protein [Actinomycetota bacterium]|nr:VOC family protein [Actinomycetota bacterium]